MSDSTMPPRCLDLMVDIVCAHFEHNAVPAEALPALIEEVYCTLAAVATGSAPPNAAADKPQPAVPVKRSIFADYIVCLEDGKQLKMLKRHLRTFYNMTPEQYRSRWGLPFDYPMVAPSYASHRSVLARSIGLGRKKAPPAAVPTPEPEPPVTHLKARRAKGSRG